MAEGLGGDARIKALHVLSLGCLWTSIRFKSADAVYDGAGYQGFAAEDGMDVVSEASGGFRAVMIGGLRAA